jgi:hypothetical protein
MKKEEALQIIKLVINDSIKKGVIENIDIAVKVAEAFNIICNELIETHE